MKTLLVEHNDHDAEILRLSLSRAGAQLTIVRANDLPSAIAALTAGGFDAVLLSLPLKGVPSADCVEAIQRVDRDAAVVVLSYRSDEGHAIEVLKRGVQDHLVKWQGGGRAIVRAVRYAVERKRTVSKLSYLARFDWLTGVPNREYLCDQLQRAANRALRGQKKFGLLFIDLDRFKLVNDTLGHRLGDELLRAVVARIKDNIRASDLLARLGGDEFAILLEDVEDPREMEAVARTLVSCFEQPFALGPHHVAVTASIGITLCPGDDADPAALLNNADIAMYRAKERGRNTFQFFTQKMHEEIARSQRLERDMNSALAEDRFLLLFQPQVSLIDGHIHGVEALLRWNHPEWGLVGPDDFLTMAEGTGHIVPIGLWVVDQACQQLRRWESMGLEVPRISVNIAPMHLYQPDFAARIAHAIDRHGVDPARIELEVTERPLREDPDGVRASIVALKKVGVRIAIDDFGTGYSCLRYLRRLPIDALKIDKSFVRGIDTDADERAICGVILSIAKGMSLEAIAEGVETEGQLGELLRLGCQYGQGNYFRAPLSAAETAALLPDKITQALPEEDAVRLPPLAADRSSQPATLAAAAG